MSSNLVEAIYYIPTKILSQKEFSTESTFKEILDFFTFNLYPKYSSKIILKKNYFYQKYKINETTKLKDILNLSEYPENAKPKIYIKLNDLMSQESVDYFSFILKPKINPFGFIIYSVKTNTIYHETIQKNIIKTYNLDKYNPDMSAHCNTNDTLYISGGIKPNKDPISDFWIVDYTYNITTKKFNFKITHNKMPVEKKQHSMLYNKKDNSIFIVGGNEKICLKYDIATKNFMQLPDTNAQYVKPALFIKNDSLYVLDSFDKRKMFFEKLDLNNINKKKFGWEKIFPKNYEKFVSQCYGICDMNLDDKIILLGGDRVDNNIILYEIKNNKLENGKGTNSYAKLNDKNFYRINKNYYISIPEFKVKESWLIAIDNITKDVSKIYFDEEGKTISNFDSTDECDISLEPVIKNINDGFIKNKNIVFKSNSGMIIDDVEEKKDKNEKYNLKSTNKNIDLSEIKKNNNDLTNSNVLKKLDTVEMNFQQEIKDDKDSDNLYILREPFNPKKSEKNEEEKNTNIIKINLNDIGIKNKKINLNLNSNLNNIETKSKKINLKLSNNGPMSPKNINKKKNYSANNKITSHKGYLNYEGDDWKNKKFNNYKYHNMTPNYHKKKNIVNQSTNIKNPLLLSRRITKKNIEGHEYSLVCEKIIDKNNLKLYNSFNDHQSYDFEDLYGNHKFYVSQYLNDEKDKNILDNELKMQSMSDYKYYTERNKNIDNFRDNFEKENIEKNKFNKNLPNEIGGMGEIKINDFNQNKNIENNQKENNKEQDEKEEITNLINSLNINSTNKNDINKNIREQKIIAQEPKKEELNEQINNENNNVKEKVKDDFICNDKNKPKNKENIHLNKEKEEEKQVDSEEEEEIEIVINNKKKDENNLEQNLEKNELINKEKKETNEDKNEENKNQIKNPIESKENENIDLNNYVDKIKIYVPNNLDLYNMIENESKISSSINKNEDNTKKSEENENDNNIKIPEDKSNMINIQQNPKTDFKDMKNEDDRIFRRNMLVNIDNNTSNQQGSNFSNEKNDFINKINEIKTNIIKKNKVEVFTIKKNKNENNEIKKEPEIVIENPNEKNNNKKNIQNYQDNINNKKNIIFGFNNFKPNDLLYQEEDINKENEIIIPKPQEMNNIEENEPQKDININSNKEINVKQIINDINNNKEKEIQRNITNLINKDNNTSHNNIIKQSFNIINEDAKQQEINNEIINKDEEKEENKKIKDSHSIFKIEENNEMLNQQNQENDMSKSNEENNNNINNNSNENITNNINQNNEEGIKKSRNKNINQFEAQILNQDIFKNRMIDSKEIQEQQKETTSPNKEAQIKTEETYQSIEINLNNKNNDTNTKTNEQNIISEEGQEISIELKNKENQEKENEKEIIPETEIIKEESNFNEDNTSNNYGIKVSKHKINFIINNSEILNQITSTEIKGEEKKGNKLEEEINQENNKEINELEQKVENKGNDINNYQKILNQNENNENNNNIINNEFEIPKNEIEQSTNQNEEINKPVYNNNNNDNNIISNVNENNNNLNNLETNNIKDIKEIKNIEKINENINNENDINSIKEEIPKEKENINLDIDKPIQLENQNQNEEKEKENELIEENQIKNIEQQIDVNNQEKLEDNNINDKNNNIEEEKNQEKEEIENQIEENKEIENNNDIKSEKENDVIKENENTNKENEINIEINNNNININNNIEGEPTSNELYNVNKNDLEENNIQNDQENINNIIKNNIIKEEDEEVNTNENLNEIRTVNSKKEINIPHIEFKINQNIIPNQNLEEKNLIKDDDINNETNLEFKENNINIDINEQNILNNQNIIKYKKIDLNKINKKLSNEGNDLENMEDENNNNNLEENINTENNNEYNNNIPIENNNKNDVEEIKISENYELNNNNNDLNDNNNNKIDEKNINNINTNEEKNNIISTSKTPSEVIQNEGVDSNIITKLTEEKMDQNQIKEVIEEENNNINIYNNNNINIENSKNFTFKEKSQNEEEQEINTELKNQNNPEQIINNKENEFNSIENRNKDDKNKWIINNEEINTLKQDNTFSNKIRISKLLKKDENLTLFEVMDEPSMINLNLDIEYPEINKIIFTQEELDGKNEKNINDLLKLPEYMIGDWKNEKENEDINEKNDLQMAYTPQKMIGKKPIFTKKINNVNTEGKNINLNKLNLKSLNIYQSKNKNNKYLKMNNNLKLINEDIIENNNINKNFETYNESKIRIHKNNLNYITNSNAKINNQLQVFVKKKPVKSSVNQQNKIEDNINNIKNDE